MTNKDNIPEEFRMKYMIKNGTDKLSYSYDTYRIFILDKTDGSISFLRNRKGVDWKTYRNAKKEADKYNDPNGFDQKYYGKNKFAIAKKVTITIMENEDE